MFRTNVLPLRAYITCYGETFILHIFDVFHTLLLNVYNTVLFQPLTTPGSVYFNSL